MSDSPLVLRVQGLEKTFFVGFFRKRVEAVRGIDFEVAPGEIFGLLGPNGAGKTSTIKMILGLVFPKRGSIALFGSQERSVEVMRRLGYLPENPYVYQYLRPLEFLDLCGRLFGLDARTRRRRSAEMVERVGLGHATDRPIGKFSKGMMQRIGLAQALLHDPELLILDEPMSGLDPIGRKEVRDLILEQRRRGKTILFTSHILSDVEMLCDRVGIMQRGKMAHYGRLEDLLHSDLRQTEIVVEGLVAEQLEALEAIGEVVSEDARAVFQVDGDPGEALQRILAAGGHVVSVTPHRETLEDLFVRTSKSADVEA